MKLTEANFSEYKLSNKKLMEKVKQTILFEKHIKESQIADESIPIQKLYKIIYKNN